MPIELSKDNGFPERLKEKLKNRYLKRNRSEDIIHVSDITTYSCIRKAYFARKNPELNNITDTDLDHFLRGESSEMVITNLADIGIAQKELEFDGIIAHPDILNDDLNLIIELKDTNYNKKLDIHDEKFKGYLKQLLYYLVISGYEFGILSIRYSSKKMTFIKRNENGDEYYFVPINSDMPKIESWKIKLPKDDFLRDLLKNELIRRKKLLQEALKSNKVTILPRLREDLRNSHCMRCKFFSECMKETNEDTAQAKEMACEKDILDIPISINFINSKNS